MNTENPGFIFSAQFNNVGADGVLAFNDLVCPEEFEDGDSIETSYTEDSETKLHEWVYLYGAWYDMDEGYRPCTEEDGLELGQSAWFWGVSGEPRTITTAGEVLAENKVHSFDEPGILCSSYFPIPFCPNNENVSWELTDFDTIETVYTEEGETKLHEYVWMYGAWYDMDAGYALLGEDDPITASGEGFWLWPQDVECCSFSEVSPLAE